MRTIPKELQVYFPNAPYPERPWWRSAQDGACMERAIPNWSRTIRVDRPSTGATVEDLLQENDREAPLPPPPILVGQVWASPLSGGRWRVSVIAGVVHESDGTLTITFANDRFEPGSWLHSHGILLTCPFGYAPWSGPAVP